MKLYELPRESYFKIVEEGASDEVFYFDHVDGMYSYCLDACKDVCHLKAWLEVEVVNGRT